MNKHIFNEKIRYKPDARTLAKRTNVILRPLFEEYMDMGYSPIEISHILISSVMYIENETILGF